MKPYSLDQRSSTGMPIVVTGGAGYIGSLLVRTLLAIDAPRRAVAGHVGGRERSTDSQRMEA